MVELLCCPLSSIFAFQIRRAYIVRINSSVICLLFWVLTGLGKLQGSLQSCRFCTCSYHSAVLRERGVLTEFSWIPRWGFWFCQNILPHKLESNFVFGFYYSKLLGCKQKIIDLLPKIEVALNNIKEADNSVMQMQGKRQREIWHLLKIACVSSFWTTRLLFLPVQEPGDIRWNSEESIKG